MLSWIVNDAKNHHLTFNIRIIFFSCLVGCIELVGCDVLLLLARFKFDKLNCKSF